MAKQIITKIIKEGVVLSIYIYNTYIIHRWYLYKVYTFIETIQI